MGYIYEDIKKRTKTRRIMSKRPGFSHVGFSWVRTKPPTLGADTFSKLTIFNKYLFRVDLVSSVSTEYLIFKYLRFFIFESS